MYIGIDCSMKAVHISVLDEDGKILSLKKYESALKSADERLFEIIRKLQKDMKLYSGARAAYVENPIYIQNAIATKGISSVVGCVKWIFHEQGIPIWGVENRQWKKDVLGDGSSSKDKIMEWACVRWKRKFKEQDWADSSVIAEFCRKRFVTK